jgi:hypothetical protein
MQSNELLQKIKIGSGVALAFLIFAGLKGCNDSYLVRPRAIMERKLPGDTNLYLEVQTRIGESLYFIKQGESYLPLEDFYNVTLNSERSRLEASAKDLTDRLRRKVPQ